MVDRKPRGELSELGATLQGLCVGGKRSDKELRSAKKDAFKKVISYMTLGMDMSSLFPMMISCANLSSDDVVLKKMLYLYITHYAQQTPDLALLTINQLHKDCADQDPTVRGLALRSLCSLRVANFLEYVMTPINTGLEDRHPYVRRTAVLGVLKVGTAAAPLPWPRADVQRAALLQGGRASQHGKRRAALGVARRRSSGGSGAGVAAARSPFGLARTPCCSMPAPAGAPSQAWGGGGEGRLRVEPPPANPRPPPPAPRPPLPAPRPPPHPYSPSAPPHAHCRGR
jgi:hypothetical protein